MAFSVLGTVIKETVLEEKRCVEKTWPNWWDDLENKVHRVYARIRTRSYNLFRSDSKLRVSNFTTHTLPGHSARWPPSRPRQS